MRALTADVLRRSLDGSAADRVAAWLARNAAPVDRCLQVLGDVKAGGTFDLATLSVAVREIRNLIDASVAPAPEPSGPLEPEVAPVGR
jgi:glutamate dehydrogenase